MKWHTEIWLLWLIIILLKDMPIKNFNFYVLNADNNFSNISKLIKIGL